MGRQGKSDRQRIIEWYRDDIDNYERKIKKYSSLVETLKERIIKIEEEDRKDNKEL